MEKSSYKGKNQMKNLLKNILPFIIIILLVIPSVLPLFNSGFFTMHDDEQIARLFDLHASLQAFHIPPRIVPNLGFGYGYPFFNFYPPFAYYVGELFHLVGFGYIDSTKLMLVTGYILSAVFMYIFAKEFFGRLGGVVAATAYTYVSYHAVDVYVRGAFAEFFAFVFIPLIFWAVYKLSKTLNFRYICIGSIGLAGLILSHNLIALMTMPFLIVWGTWLYLTVKNKRAYVQKSIALLFLGFGLCAYFWLPSFFERQTTIINILTSELANYSLHFVCVRQLWDSPWGYGGSIQGCMDGISFEVGKLQLIASFIAFLLASIALTRGKKGDQIFSTLVFSALLLICLALMTKYSKFIWDMIPPLWYIQFPWRFLLLSSFISAFLTGSVISFIKYKSARIIVSILIIVLLIVFNFSNFMPQRRIHVSDNFYINTEKIRWDTSSLAYEYVPKGIQIKKSEIGTTKVDITKDEIAKSPFKVISGKMEVAPIDIKPQYKKLDLYVEKPGIIQVNTFSFPGWEVFLDGKKTTFTDSNKLKLIRVAIPSGAHILEARFTDTPIRTIGNSASIISIIILIGGCIWYHSRKNNKSK